MGAGDLDCRQATYLLEFDRGDLVTRNTLLLNGVAADGLRYGLSGQVCVDGRARLDGVVMQGKSTVARLRSLNGQQRTERLAARLWSPLYIPLIRFEGQGGGDPSGQTHCLKMESIR